MATYPIEYDISKTIFTDVAPNAVANVIEQSTLQNIREIEHRDAEGNVIGMLYSIGQKCSID